MIFPKQIKIQKAAPIPPKSGRPATSTYPYDNMKLNESFIAGKYSEELVNKMNASIRYYGKKLKMTFCLRKVGENLTIWRSE